jgi:hypothetical protein
MEDAGEQSRKLHARFLNAIRQQPNVWEVYKALTSEEKETMKQQWVKGSDCKFAKKTSDQ